MNLCEAVFMLSLVVYTCCEVSLGKKTRDRQRGALIGQLKKLQRDVSGTLWAVDENTLYVEGFTYDSKGPDAFFLVGNDTQPNPRGFIIPYPIDTPLSRQQRLPNFHGENLILDLPSPWKIKDLRWFSVWATRFTLDYGHVYIPEDLDPPTKKELPELRRIAHGVRSGNITILDAKTFYIPNLHYDGKGAEVYFWVGRGYKPDQLGQKVPNEQGSSEPLRGYEGEDIEIQLPDNLTVYDVDYLAIWCVAHRHSLGYVHLPPSSNIWVPPSLGQTKIKPHWWYREDSQDSLTQPKFANCREISEDLQVEWQAGENQVQIRLTARIEDDQYIIFGLARHKHKLEMMNSDIVVAYYDKEDESFHAVDYAVTARFQCNGKFGVCPDEKVSGRNDAAVISGERHGGITSITYSRPYETYDRLDIPITRGNEIVTILAAIGSLNEKKEAQYHDRFITKENSSINFKSVGENTCTTLLPKRQSIRYRPWPPNILRDVMNFSVALGPTGGLKGYQGMTNTTPPRLVWWVNSKLIPEIYVDRGKTYYFKVEGGYNISNPYKKNTHPFYITDSPQGGFEQKILDEQRRETIYAGIAYSHMGIPYPTAFGRLCQWQHKGRDSWRDSNTFKHYRSTVHKVCESGQPGFLNWTVAEETPDLVYYQSFAAPNMGWKIHVLSSGYNLHQSISCSTSGSMVLLATCLFLSS